MVDLTPGSRRKLLRHINEGKFIADLVEEMQISSADLRNIIMADDELSKACRLTGALSKEDKFRFKRASANSVSMGMNRSFVRNALRKRQREASRGETEQSQPKRRVRKKALPHVDIAVFFKSVTVRLAGDPAKVINFYGKSVPYKNKPTVRSIIECVIRGTPFTYEDILGGGRKKHMVELRQIAIANSVAIRTDLSLPAIARQFGNRHHTTIIHAARKMGVPDRRADLSQEQRAV